MTSVIPMLKRIDSSNEILKLKSLNEINLLESEPSLSVLRDLIRVLKKEKLKGD